MSQHKMDPRILSLLRSNRTNPPKNQGGTGFPHTSTELVLRPENSNDANGYYEYLGLKPNATRKEIREAFAKMAKEMHPDTGGDVEEFQYLLQIHEVLTDPLERHNYDTIPEGLIYLGQREKEQLNAKAPINREQIIKESEKMTMEPASWSYYSDDPDYDLAEKWYGYLIPVFQALGVKANIRLHIAGSEPIIKVKGIRKDQFFVTLPKGISPNYFVAFHLVRVAIESSSNG